MCKWKGLQEDCASGLLFMNKRKFSSAFEKEPAGASEGYTESPEESLHIGSGLGD